MESPDQRHSQPLARPRASALPSGAVVVDLAAVVMYVALHSRLHDATASLAIATALPAIWTLLTAITRRRLDPIGLLSVAAFAIAIGITVLAGGGSLPLKLGKATLTAIIGLLLVVSVALGRPLLGPLVEAVHRTPARGGRRRAAALARRGPSSTAGVATLAAGIVALVDAVAQVALAAALSTSSFVVVGTITRWTILGAGGAAIARYIRRADRE